MTHKKLGDAWDEDGITKDIKESFPDIGLEKQRRLRERYYRIWRYMHEQQQQ